MIALIILLFAAPPAVAQTFEAVGTKAAGMGGAFVAVADDASAVYWNPAGLVLGGSYFSMVLDYNEGQAEPDDISQAGRRSSNIIAFSTLPVGVSVLPADVEQADPHDRSPARAPRSSDDASCGCDARPVPHRSLRRRCDVEMGARLRRVRHRHRTGTATTSLTAPASCPDASTSKFDADIGVMASLGAVRAGLTVRNVIEPDFSTATRDPVAVLTMKRQTRAGVSYVGVPGLIVAADLDVERAAGSLGEVRDLAAGAEAKLFRRVAVRSGFRFNTLGDEPGGHAPVYSLGGSVATFRQLLVDAQVTLGSRARRPRLGHRGAAGLLVRGSGIRDQGSGIRAGVDSCLKPEP